MKPLTKVDDKCDRLQSGGSTCPVRCSVAIHCPISACIGANGAAHAGTASRRARHASPHHTTRRGPQAAGPRLRNQHAPHRPADTPHHRPRALQASRAATRNAAHRGGCWLQSWRWMLLWPPRWPPLAPRQTGSSRDPPHWRLSTARCPASPTGSARRSSRAPQRSPPRQRGCPRWHRSPRGSRTSPPLGSQAGRSPATATTPAHRQRRWPLRIPAAQPPRPRCPPYLHKSRQAPADAAGARGGTQAQTAFHHQAKLCRSRGSADKQERRVGWRPAVGMVRMYPHGRARQQRSAKEAGGHGESGWQQRWARAALQSSPLRTPAARIRQQPGAPAPPRHPPHPLPPPSPHPAPPRPTRPHRPRSSVPQPARCPLAARPLGRGGSLEPQAPGRMLPTHHSLGHVTPSAEPGTRKPARAEQART